MLLPCDLLAVGCPMLFAVLTVDDCYMALSDMYKTSLLRLATIHIEKAPDLQCSRQLNHMNIHTTAARDQNPPLNPHSVWSSHNKL